MKDKQSTGSSIFKAIAPFLKVPYLSLLAILNCSEAVLISTVTLNCDINDEVKTCIFIEIFALHHVLEDLHANCFFKCRVNVSCKPDYCIIQWNFESVSFVSLLSGHSGTWEIKVSNHV